MEYLKLDEILRLHFEVINDFGGSHGVRDLGRLESLVSAPSQNIFGSEQYSTLLEKAAVYLRNIIADHPFIDGNKRTGVTCMAIFLSRNRRNLTCTSKALEDFAVKVATDHLDIAEIAAWLKSNTSS